MSEFDAPYDQFPVGVEGAPMGQFPVDDSLAEAQASLEALHAWSDSVVNPDGLSAEERLAEAQERVEERNAWSYGLMPPSDPDVWRSYDPGPPPADSSTLLGLTPEQQEIIDRYGWAQVEPMSEFYLWSGKYSGEPATAEEHASYYEGREAQYKAQMSPLDLARYEGRPDSDADVARADEMVQAYAFIHQLFPEHDWSQPLNDTQWMQVETEQMRAHAFALSLEREAAASELEQLRHENESAREVNEHKRFVDTYEDIDYSLAPNDSPTAPQYDGRPPTTDEAQATDGKV